MWSLKHPFANFTYPIKRWLTVMKDLFHRWRRTYSDWCTKNLSSFPRMWAFRMTRITGCNYMSNATGSKNGTRSIYPSRAPEILPVFGIIRSIVCFVYCYFMFCHGVLSLFSTCPFGFVTSYLSSYLWKYFIFTNFKMTASPNRRESPE